MVAAALLLPLALLPQVLRADPAAVRRESAWRPRRRRVLDLRPVVILYFSGGVDAVYQVNMWLETMERLGRPVLVLLRERRYLDAVGPDDACRCCACRSPST